MQKNYATFLRWGINCFKETVHDFFRDVKKATVPVDVEKHVSSTGKTDDEWEMGTSASE